MNFLTDIVYLEELELKEVLRDFQRTQKNFVEENGLLIVNSMLKNIGSADSEFRDQLIYSTFCQLIIDDKLNHDTLRDVLDICLNDLLFKGIGENETDTVFIRSFASLFIAAILYKDNQDDFLSKIMIKEVKNKLINYINQEKDLRGYVPGKGWAYSIAHVSDAFEQLVKNPKVDKKHYPKLLKTLWNKIYVCESVYIHDEDERILIPVFEMMNRGLEYEEIETLIKNTDRELNLRKTQISEEEYWNLYSNCKTFLKSFYIKAAESNNLSTLQKSIGECLSKIS